LKEYSFSKARGLLLPRIHIAAVDGGTFQYKPRYWYRDPPGARIKNVLN
jgi:hypothetical protein